METETPVYKHDLVRFNDNYGRERQGYEGKTFHVPLNDREYPKSHMFHKPRERYDTEKVIGSCALSIVRCHSEDDLLRVLKNSDASLVGILKGEILNSGKPFLPYGDIASLAEVRARPSVRLAGEVELMLIKNTKK